MRGPTQMGLKNTPVKTNGSGARRCHSLTASYLKKIAIYDPATGLFTALIARGSRTKIGDILGSVDAKGYRQIMIDGIYHRACRLAFLYMTGDWPLNDIDHINRIPYDDRWANLRDVTRSENLRNTSATAWSGYKGVYASGNKYMAQITINGKRIYLGTYSTAKEASEVYQQARLKYFGEVIND